MKKVKSKIIAMLRRMSCAFSFATITAANGLSASAAGNTMTLDASTDVVAKIEKISTLFTSIAQVFGTIIAICGAIYLGKSFMSRQTEERAVGIGIIIGGVIIAAAGSLVQWLLG